MLDLLLLFIAGLCQLGVAWLGSRVSAHPPDLQHARRLGVAFILIGLIGFGAIIWSGLRSNTVQQGTWDGVQKLLGLIKGKKSDENLFAGCVHTLAAPLSVPADGVIYELSLWPFPLKNISTGLTMVTSVPGTPWKWPVRADNFPLDVSRCSIINYGPDTIFNVNLLLHLIFREAIKNEKDGITTGAVTLERDWLISVAKLDSGAEHAFIYYTYNLSKQWVYVDFPSSATFQKDNNKVSLSIPVVQSENHLTPFPPFE